MNRSITDKTEVRVRFNEADSLGIVWHGNYIRYFEDGRESFGMKHGLDYLAVFNKGYILPIVKIECNYKRPLAYGDRLLIETTYTPCAAAKIHFHYKIFNATTGLLAADGYTIQVFLDKATNTLELTNPPFFEEWKRAMGMM